MAGSQSDAEQPLIGNEKFKAMYENSWEKGDGFMAEQVKGLDLPDAAKVNILHIHEATHDKNKEIYYYRRVTTALFIMQAVAGAIVPILIPFGQTYEGKSRVLLGQKIQNLGELLLIIAVTCSLIGSISMVVERAGKFSKLAYAYNKEQEEKICAISRFLALGGKYKKYADHKAAYPAFIDDVCSIFDSNSRAKIFGDTGTSAGKQDESQHDTSTSQNEET